MNEYIKVELNGKTVEGIPGETILEMAKRLSVDIPTLCHDHRLEPYASCYLCVVEVEGMRGNQLSCSTQIAEGMKITTESDALNRARKAALDLMLSNHYADCVGPCKLTCPAGVDVQGYISLIDKGMYREAVALIKETNPLPAICGRVCVRPCEVACRRTLLEENTAVGIDYLKRFAADADLISEYPYKPELKEKSGKKVAIIGAGPGGLSAAYYLQKEGHQCDIFEAAPKPGGWLRYGIPEYRLPNDLLDQEIKTITDLGANIHCDKKLGENLSYAEIKSNFDACVLTIGSQKGTLIGCKGEDAENVYSGIDFLRNMEMTGQRYDFSGKTVVVVGGGNTAMDCCRTSIRCKAEKVYVVYRRTEKEMPANPIEIHESKMEGVEYLFLTNPTEVNKDENGKLKSLTLIKMELGAPDASGRRRPVPLPGSEFELPCDYILAAIGQKTEVNFLKEVNAESNGNELKLNRWGDIDANPATLQTGVPDLFAAGDGVTGPATIIEAIAQAKIAARSVNQYLKGEELVPEPKEFLSKRDHFKKQIKADYQGLFPRQLRHEMPVLSPDSRMNFDEVELGYDSAEVAKSESQRCLECGCSELYVCDLKKHATTYGAEQGKLDGEFIEHTIDFRHPFIEIDNNKCILCSRCIRICSEVVGAHALGLVNRGFKTIVAPALNDSLTESSCEDCGMCIETCPTGAITENVHFKPGPVQLQTIETVDPFGAEGYEISLRHNNGFFYRANSRPSEVNKKDYISRQAKFGYRVFNMPDRILQPLKKEKDAFVPIDFEEAYDLIAAKIGAVSPDENAIFGGARLSNEELYLLQKLARAGIGTNNVASFHYLGRGPGYFHSSNQNAEFCDLRGATLVVCLGAEISEEHSVINHVVFNTKSKEELHIKAISENMDSPIGKKADSFLHVKSYFSFVRAVNHYLLSQNMQNQLFIDDQTEGFAEYKEQLLATSFEDHLEKAGVSADEVSNFANLYNREMNAIILYSEKENGANTSLELHNLAMITGKYGKTANGIICLKEKTNSQGIHDMGVCPKIGLGKMDILDEDRMHRMEFVWKKEGLPKKVNSPFQLMKEGRLKNLLIFGEDPIGCALKPDVVADWLKATDFVVVQDFIMSETAKMADLILPASMIFESGGHTSSTQRKIQYTAPQLKKKLKHQGFEQILQLLKAFGMNGLQSLEEVNLEIMKLLPRLGDYKPSQFVYKEGDNQNRMFEYGCDVLHKNMELQFQKS